MFDFLIHAFVATQTWVHETLVQPAMFAMGLMHLSEMAFDALEWVLIGIIEVIGLAVVLGLLGFVASISIARYIEAREGEES